MRQEKVFVGMSGGVDSSVAALRLKQQGYDVTGVFIKVWQPDFLKCDWERERLDAMRVAAHLEIPFLICDAEETYRHEVAEYMINEYKAGRTPNPDVMCNKHVKFGAFLAFAHAHGAHYVATGHYAQIRQASGHFSLLRGNDTEKDQSYFLWTLTQAQLTHTLFPVGDTPKDQIRKEAHRAGLPTAQKDDSQGICFLGAIDIKEFLAHYVTSKTGDVLDVAGNVIGTHDGALFYTTGQRHGLYITGDTKTPHYVIAKNLESNTLTVAPTPPYITSKAHSLSITNTNEIVPFAKGKTYTAQFRYRQKPVPAQLQKYDSRCGMLSVLKDAETPAEGQSCVLYDNELCVGGGIISNTPCW